MKATFFALLAGMALLLGSSLALTGASAGEVTSLRGATDIPTTRTAVVEPAVETPTTKAYPRSFTGAPPLVPHDISGDEFVINLDSNSCLVCHDKETYKDAGAPVAGVSHYQGEKISMKRYFCNQCHVPQTDATPLVVNTFKFIDAK